MKRIFLLFVLVAIISFNYNTHASHHNQFDDTILYNIKWPGQNEKLLVSSRTSLCFPLSEFALICEFFFQESINQANSVIGVTDKQEKFICRLPELIQPENVSQSYCKFCTTVEY